MNFTYAAYGRMLENLLTTHKAVTYDNLRGHHEPVFVLRHDIDYGLEFLGDIPAIEYELGVRATYFLQVASDFYNIFSPAQYAVMENLKSLGHCFGLHSDSPVRVSAEEIQNFIDWEKSVLSLAKVRIDAISFHQPSDAVLNNSVKIHEINTYDRQDMSGYSYLADSRGRWPKGDPMEYLAHHPGASLQILVHPILWGREEHGFHQVALDSVDSKAEGLRAYLYKHIHDLPERR